MKMTIKEAILKVLEDSKRALLNSLGLSTK